MKIITIKKSNEYALFLIISGIGALWLTIMWYLASTNHNLFAYKTPSPYILYYYIFNSILMISLGCVLRFKNFKLYAALAILLGISVTASLFIFQNGNVKIINNLFISTTYSGMIFGGIYGGTLLVPMFLAGVYISFLRGVQYIQGKIDYVVSDIDTGNLKAEHMPVSIDVENQKSNIQKIIPIIAIVLGLLKSLNFFLSLDSLISFGLLEKEIPYVILQIFLVTLSIFSLASKKIKVFRVINIIIVILMLLPIFSLGINLFMMLLNN